MAENVDIKNLKNTEYNISAMLVNRDFLHKINKHNKYNKVIADYYYRLSSETKSKKEFWSLLNKVDRMKACNQYWEIDKYVKTGMNDFVRNWLCRDNYCANCKKVRQAQRMSSYMPLFEKYDSSLYFLTITVPNCSGQNLKAEISKLFKTYNALMKCFYSKSKVFDRLGLDEVFGECLGALRSLEVTYKKTGRYRFHHHLHVAIILPNYVISRRYIKNKFSMNRDKEVVKLFNKEEIKLQKLVYLLHNGFSVKDINDDKIQKVELGYSLTLEKFKPGAYGEMFKYMIKDNFDDINTGDDLKKIMDYETFKIFYYNMKNVKQISGSGIFKNINDDYDLEIEKQVSEIYNLFIYSLKQRESPVRLQETPMQILNNLDNVNKPCVYFSRKKIFSFLRICLLEEKFTVDDFVIENNISLFNYTLLDELCNDVLAWNADNIKNKKVKFMLESECITLVPVNSISL